MFLSYCNLNNQEKGKSMKAISMKKIIAAASILVIGATAQAQTGATTATNTSTNSWSSAYKKLKDGPVFMQFLFDNSTMVDNKTHETNGLDSTNINYIGYKKGNDQIRLENRYKYRKVESRDAVTSYDRIHLAYTRSNILTEKEHGVGLRALLEGRYLPQGSVRQATGSYGLARGGFAVSKTLGALNLSYTLYHGRFNRMDGRNSVDDNKSYMYNILGQSYQINDTFSVSLTEEITAFNKDSNTGEDKALDLTLDLGASITNEISVGLSVAGSPIAATDHWDVDTQWGNKLTYGANLFLTVF